MQFQRIKDLREDKDLTQKELADILFMHREQYRRYEIGQSPVSLELAVTLSDFYNVSIDYIAGKTNKKFEGYNKEETKIIEIWNTLSEREKGQFEHLYKEIMKERERQKSIGVG